MPGGKGKVHGRGGRKGHHTRETERQVERVEGVEGRITRQQVKRVKKVIRRSRREFEETVRIAQDEIGKITSAFKSRRISSNTKYIRFIALQEWFAVKMKDVVIVEADGSLSHLTRKETDFLRTIEDAGLIELRTRSAEPMIREQIEKWKRRIGKPGY